jgi:hypothetical protein
MHILLIEVIIGVMAMCNMAMCNVRFNTFFRYNTNRERDKYIMSDISNHDDMIMIQ